MSIAFHEVAFPILACAGLACLLLPAPKAARYVVGALAGLYAVVLLVQSFAASA